METIIDEVRIEVSRQMKRSTRHVYATDGIKTPERFLMAIGSAFGDANLAVLGSNMNGYCAALIKIAATAIIAVKHFEQHE